MQWLTDIPAGFWTVVGEMAPYLLFGFFVAGVLSVLISPELVERHLGGGGLGPVIKAAAFGVPLPLCSCGVIPVAASIRRHGASRGAVTAFLISTPQTGVDSILATLGLLGPVFTIFRALAALVSGVVGGAIVSLTGREAAEGGEPAPECTDACCTGQAGRGRMYRAMAYAFVTLPRDIGRTLLIGLVVAALISAAVPEGYFSKLVPPGVGQILLLMLVGIPIYICATASIPIAAGLILAGVSPGAAFALLMTGPATNAATVTTVWKVLGRRTCLIYLGTMMAAALGGGLLLDQLVTAADVRTAMQHGWMPGWVKSASGVVLLVVLAAGALPRRKRRAQEDEPEGDPPLKLRITGMTCSHCAAAVRTALLECTGVETVEVDLAGARADVGGGELDAAALCDAVRELGYSARAAE